MDIKLFKERMESFEGACKQLEALPEVLFASGTVGGRRALLFLSGSQLNLESLKQLKADIIEVLDAKDRQLRGIDDPNNIKVSF